jgi:eukaryotic-like serine/threonine-protein kinase
VIEGTASKLADALRDRYAIERELGRGGMATVYLARDLKHGRDVALKVLHAELASSVGPDRFQREIETVARLQHPHILTVYDSGEAAGQLWFTMPFVEGESLRDRLSREQQLPIDVALRIAKDAARALQYAHEHGVIHRDVKPENLLLTTDGSTLVADFGIARALSGSNERLTETGISVGTPAYMSPEQAAGTRTIDARADVYALGAVLHEMLAGEPPFTGPTPQAVIAKRFHSDPIPLRAVRPSVPAQVEHAVNRALARVATDRFASTAELARSLDQEPSPATIQAPSLGPGRGRVIPPGVLILGLGILIGLGVLFAWTQAQHGSTGQESGLKRMAVLPFENLGGQDKAYFADGITDEIRGKLATVAGLQVTARTSSAQYRQTTKSPQEIGRELGVEYLLTGTVRWDQEGNRSRVRVSPELVQAASGSSRWQQSFDAPLTDVFQVQADVAARVARELGIALEAGQRHHLEERPTGDLGAYDLYLKGRYAWHQRTAKGLDQARRFLEQAIEQDPAFAPAHAALADVYTVVGLWSDLPPDQTYPRAKAEALEALRLDSTLAGPYAVLGDVNAMYEWDWAAADRNFRRSLVLDANNASTHHWYNVHYLLTVGRHKEAVGEARRASELDPLSLTINGELGRTLYALKRFQEAATQLQGALAIDSTFVLVNEYLGTLYLTEGRAAEAVPLLQRAIDPAVHHSIPTALLGYALAKVGRRHESEALLRELLARQSKGYVSPVSIALISAGLGDTARTFASLERAAQIHDPFLIYNFTNEPLLERLRREPRGLAILRRMRLPEAVATVSSKR